MNSPTSFAYEICNKKYSSKSSLCNHNKKFHNNNNVICQKISKNCQKNVKICQKMSKFVKICQILCVIHVIKILIADSRYGIIKKNVR